jgi:hypothetical protein
MAPECRPDVPSWPALSSRHSAGYSGQETEGFRTCFAQGSGSNSHRQSDSHSWGCSSGGRVQGPGFQPGAHTKNKTKTPPHPTPCNMESDSGLTRPGAACWDQQGVPISADPCLLEGGTKGVPSRKIGRRVCRTGVGLTEGIQAGHATARWARTPHTLVTMLASP